MKKHFSQKFIANFIFACAFILLGFSFSAAQSKNSRSGEICGDAAKAGCTKTGDKIWKPSDLVFDSHGYDENSTDEFFSQYFYAIVLETVVGYKEKGGCREITETQRLAAQKLFPNNKAFSYNYYCQSPETGESFISYSAKGLTETTHFLALFGGKTAAEAAKILPDALKKYPKAKIIRMRAAIVFQGDV